MCVPLPTTSPRFFFFFFFLLCIVIILHRLPSDVIRLRSFFFFFVVVDVFLFFFFEDLKREVLFLRIYGENYPQANTHVAVSSSFLVRACEGTSKSRIRAAKGKKNERESN